MIVLNSSTSYPVSYDAGMGGYGYYDSGKSWHYYSPDDNRSTSVSFWKFLKALFIVAVIAVVVIGTVVFVSKAITARRERQEREEREAAKKQRDLEIAQQRQEERAKDPLREWLDIAPNSFIALSDAQSLKDSKERTGVAGPIDFRVERIDQFTDKDHLARYVMLHINDDKQPLMLLIKEVDGDLDTRIYYQSGDFEPATRKKLLEEGRQFLFAPPDDPNNYHVNDLRYTADLVYNDGSGDATYVRKPQGELHGFTKSHPELKGLGNRPTTLVEYRSADGQTEPENPELLVIEVGKSAKNGEVTLYLGCPIQRSEMEILGAASV